ncbi:MAG: hypothetical protein JWQ04_90 [Pedosphaera sp.]|nr:hypothetical protein [Pedosphaera sp.]
MASEAVHPAEVALDHYAGESALLAASMLVDAGFKSWAGQVENETGEPVLVVLLIGADAEEWMHA